MKKAITPFALVFLLSVPVLRGAEFDRFVHDFARESGAKQVHIPFLGFARFVVSVGKPGGASDFRLAIFERDEIATPRFSELTDEAVGDSWKPMIRVRSKGDEATVIYGRQNGKHVQLLIATLDNDNATFVAVRIEPKELARFLDQHGHSH